MTSSSLRNSSSNFWIVASKIWSYWVRYFFGLVPSIHTYLVSMSWSRVSWFVWIMSSMKVFITFAPMSDSIRHFWRSCSSVLSKIFVIMTMAPTDRTRQKDDDYYELLLQIH